MKILLEMRPALDGHAGIPQETRLLFRELNALPGVSVDGLVQSGGRMLSPGLPVDADGQAPRWPSFSVDERIHRLSRVVVSLHQPPAPLLPQWLARELGILTSGSWMALRRLLGLAQTLTHFDAQHFPDFIWRSMFAKTLDPADIGLVTQAAFRISTVPWGAMHRFGLLTRMIAGRAIYPRLDTRGYDMMIAETPYPATLVRPTAMLVRYHDAIPLLMPHTISDKSYHHASHYEALRSNVRHGALFACVSDATRKDLLTVFPEVQERAFTIHNFVSSAYFSEPTTAERIPEILRTRRHAALPAPRGAAARTARSAAAPAQEPKPEYLLMVSTIEPRKNHLLLLSAWERLRARGHPRLKLVLVGSLGWDHATVVTTLRPWVALGEVVMLEDVPAEELRLLYAHALVTVCPSLYEGFGYSGIEAMRCGGIVAASDIVVHREIYQDAAALFGAYSAEDTASVLSRLISADGAAERAVLKSRGSIVAAQYTAARVMPKWRDLLQCLESAGPSVNPLRT